MAHYAVSARHACCVPLLKKIMYVFGCCVPLKKKKQLVMYLFGCNTGPRLRRVESFVLTVHGSLVGACGLISCGSVEKSFPARKLSCNVRTRQGQCVLGPGLKDGDSEIQSMLWEYVQSHPIISGSP